MVLGIESSCDECAIALVEDGRRVVSSVVNSQIERHKPFDGVVPELASRLHVEAVTDVRVSMQWQSPTVRDLWEACWSV